MAALIKLINGSIDWAVKPAASMARRISRQSNLPLVVPIQCWQFCQYSSRWKIDYNDIYNVIYYDIYNVIYNDIYNIIYNDI